MSTEPEFTVQQAVSVQQALRATLELGPELFGLPAFIGMISDEIAQMRSAGRSDQDIVQIIALHTGQQIAADDVRRYYAPPELRRRG